MFAVGFCYFFGWQPRDDLLRHPSLPLLLTRLLPSIPEHKNATIVQKVCDGTVHVAVEAEAAKRA